MLSKHPGLSDPRHNIDVEPSNERKMFTNFPSQRRVFLDGKGDRCKGVCVRTWLGRIGVVFMQIGDFSVAVAVVEL